jgi:hypothetical protein
MKPYSEQHRLLYQHHYGLQTPSRPRPNAWLPQIETLAEALGARDILDYGCGSARGISRFSKYPVQDYDPGVPGCDSPPTQADLVVSIHALEHVEPGTVDAVLLHMESLARKAILLVVSCEDSTKVLPDGSPWHSFVKPEMWWLKYLSGSGYLPLQPINPKPGAEFAAIWNRK